MRKQTGAVHFLKAGLQGFLLLLSDRSHCLQLENPFLCCCMLVSFIWFLLLLHNVEHCTNSICQELSVPTPAVTPDAPAC